MSNFEFSYCNHKVFTEDGGMVAYSGSHKAITIHENDPNLAARQMIHVLNALHAQREKVRQGISFDVV